MPIYNDTYLIQAGLKSLGFDPGPLDGQMGKKTIGAMQRWEDSLAAPTQMRDVSDECIALVKEFEGLFLKAYDDGGGVWTIGWGHTGLKHNDGSVFPGRTITEAKAVELLRYDMQESIKGVLALVKVDLEQHEFDALVSFQFNTGALAISSLLKHLNAGDKQSAANEFSRWVYDREQSPHPLRGLIRRRASERNLFLGVMPFIVK